MNILSLQSHVVYGHVGNSAAVFALQRLGAEVWPIHTVQLSNHKGYPTARGQAVDAALIRDLVQGLAERNGLVRCDGVLSGYFGSVKVGCAIVEAVAQIKHANPNAVYCCDPVIGDHGAPYVTPEVADFMRSRAVPAADIVTPNHFELDFLTATSTRTLPDVLTAAEGLRALGPRVVLVTSVENDDTPDGSIDLIACDAGGRHRLRTPRLPITPYGAGDATAAIFLLHYLRTGSIAEALSQAASAIFGVLKRTVAANAQEMLLVEAQDELANPSEPFQAEQL
jgi:pyridoxine kinase